MSIFRELGRRVGQFTEDAKAAAEEHGGSECADCGERVDGSPDACPECGSVNVTPRSDADGS
ncbi:hypothetical protein ACFQE1_10605 [Halobium palmae]|uniref:Small CPxCG-related zinc finger protein n=1 Tax=Halobium palmae TaxID=1776492 RepID=A0ABD5S049_9EURY